jgi:hypothetical protein
MTASSMNSAYMRRFNPDSVPGLVIDLDARDLTPGAVTSWTDRKSGYVLTGNATRDSQMNGYPSVTFNGSTNELRTTGNAITQFNGIAAVTSIIIMKDTVSGTGQWWPYGLSESTAFTTNVQTWSFIPSAGPFSNQRCLFNQAYGNMGSNYRFIPQSNLLPGILSIVGDFSQPFSSETTTIRYNSTTPAVYAEPGQPPNGASSPENTGTHGNLDIMLGRYTGGLNLGSDFAWPGSITKILAYNRRLSTAEMLYLERGVARLGGIFI